MGFGSILKVLLSERNMSIKELSEETGIPLNTLYSITKRDTINVRPETIQKIADALHISNNDILNQLHNEISETQKQLDQLQYRLQEAERKQKFELVQKEKIRESLYALTGYKFDDKEIGILISTALLLKESPAE